MSAKQGWANGGMVFAATLMIVLGIYHVFLGIAAIVEDQFFVVGANYAYEIDTTAWGWIHLGVGALATVAGFFLFTGRTWARIVAITLAVVSAVANFFFIPYYPLWALLLIAMDIFIIWAVATARPTPEMTTYGSGAASGYAGETAQSRERWPQENVAGGRHWAPEPAKEGVGGAAVTPEEAREHAAAAQRSGAPGSGQQPPSGQTPSSGQTPPSGEQPRPPGPGEPTP